MSDESYTEYGVRYAIDGTEHTDRISAASLISAHRAVVQRIRHHERHKVIADGYRVVYRTVSVTPWAEMSEQT